MTPAQTSVVRLAFARLAGDARASGLTDQDVAEWMLDVSARWLAAHGVSRANVLQWVSWALDRPKPMPLNSAARAPNEIGGRR